MLELAKLPEILRLPPKLMPIIAELNNYRYFLIEGGRGSGKTHAVARFICYLGEHYKLRVVCGREVQNKIEESVHAVLKDLVTRYNLAYRVLESEIRHLTSGSEIGFRGFKDVGGKTNVRGMEGVDIIWPDEAQQLSKRTLDDMIPTVRKDNAKFFFTMNRFMRDDPVYEFCVGRPDCLHIKINYFDNPFCPLSIKHEAEVLKNKNEKEYRHIYLGEPLSQADDFLFNYDKLHAAFEIQPFGATFGRQRIMAIDFAAQGNDLCVATILDRVSNVHWKLVERISWGEPDAMISVGKIVALKGQHKPDVTILDVGGMGHVVWNRLNEVLEGKNSVQRFDGATTQGVDTVHYANARAEGYYIVKDWFDNGWLCIDKKDSTVIHQLEKIKMRYRSDGRRILEEKVKMKKDLGYSPDDADSLMMAVYAAVKHLGRSANSSAESGKTVRRVTGSKRRA